MADAFPQLFDCFTRQWAGLTQGERDQLSKSWAAPSGRLPVPCLLKAYSVAQMERPIWTVTSGLGVSLCLLSVKKDFLGDVPGIRPR